MYFKPQISKCRINFGVQNTPQVRGIRTWVRVFILTWSDPEPGFSLQDSCSWVAVFITCTMRFFFFICLCGSFFQSFDCTFQARCFVLKSGFFRYLSCKWLPFQAPARLYPINHDLYCDHLSPCSLVFTISGLVKFTQLRVLKVEISQGAMVFLPSKLHVSGGVTHAILLWGTGFNCRVPLTSEVLCCCTVLGLLILHSYEEFWLFSKRLTNRYKQKDFRPQKDVLANASRHRSQNYIWIAGEWQSFLNLKCWVILRYSTTAEKRDFRGVEMKFTHDGYMSNDATKLLASPRPTHRLPKTFHQMMLVK